MEYEMKKLVVMGLTMLSCGAAYALPVGNPADASLYLNGIYFDDTISVDPCDPCFSWCDAFSVRAGFYGDYVFNRHLERRGDGHGLLQDADIHTNAGLLVLNIAERLDFFTTLGTTSIDLRSNATNWNASASRETDLHFKTHFSWSLGARATLWQCDCWAFGIEGQYFRTTPDLDYLVNYGDGTKNYFDENNRTKYHEWQVGLGVAYRFATSCPTLAFTPYAAVKWSGAKLRTDRDLILIVENPAEETWTINRMQNRKHWGWALGMTFSLCDMIGVTVEGRWGDESALHVNSQLRF